MADIDQAGGSPPAEESGRATAPLARGREQSLRLIGTSVLDGLPRAELLPLQSQPVDGGDRRACQQGISWLNDELR